MHVNKLISLYLEIVIVLKTITAKYIIAKQIQVLIQASCEKHKFKIYSYLASNILPY